MVDDELNALNGGVPPEAVEDDSVWDEDNYIPDPPAAAARVQPAPRPMFQALFEEYGADSGDSVLADFARYVVGPLSNEFATVTAKGGAFFRQKAAEGAKHTERYQNDQTLRAHLINGLLPTRHILRLLKRWGATRLEDDWDELTERLFIAGFILHDFTKIPEVKTELADERFKEMEAPSERQMPVLERIFTEWCVLLGLDAFLAPVGRVADLVPDLIFVATNTQQYNSTARNEALYSRLHTERRVRDLAAEASHLADLLAYVAPTPRALVAHSTIRDVITRLGMARDLPGGQAGRLVYHHVAENRGVLLNFIHNAALDALTIDDQRAPLLYAPSGVVYLQRCDAPAMPELQHLIDQVVKSVRGAIQTGMVQEKKGIKLGKDGLRADESYDDVFDLRQVVQVSADLVTLIGGNAPQYIEKMKTLGYPGSDQLPETSTDKRDARLRQMAEWASLLEIQIEERYPQFHAKFTAFVLDNWQIADLAVQFEILRTFKPEQREGTGIRYHWYWAAAHSLARTPGLSPDAVISALAMLADRLVDALPEVLPDSARANEDIWLDLTSYIGDVLTVGDIKNAPHKINQELKRYSRGKAGRGGAACALCGGDYITRKQAEIAVAFQPGVYTGRIRIGSSENKRSICSICGLEQLLRQLFVSNLDSGGTAEGQRIRYLSFYPSYFFTPETLTLVRRMYNTLTSVRISDKDLKHAMERNRLRDSTFWQRLDPFLLRPLETDSRRVVRYDSTAQATFLMLGFRGFNDPTDSESWILPAFLSLILPICLDVKVIASESGVPLLTEAGELPETIWFDGAHAAIRDLIGDGRLNVDEVLPTLTRLAAAYLIHLDTEYEPPKENWHRFPPIAHALAESPLYVFHFLKKQERNDRQASPDQVRRYVAYADLFNTQGDPLMSHAKALVEQYRRFYRAKNIGNANSILRPLSVVADTLLLADARLFNDADALIEVAYGELYRFMDRVSKGLADGRFPKGVSAAERDEAMRLFCQTFVNDVFISIFKRDVAALRGKQLNLLRSACEVLYRDAQRVEWAERGKDTDDTDEPETSAEIQ